MNNYRCLQNSQFYNYLLINLPDRYPIKPYGSWASYEAHEPAPWAGKVSSLSDVDYVTTSFFQKEIFCLVQDEIDRWSRLCGLTIIGVSLRNSRTINKLWPGRKPSDTKQHLDSNSYVSLWTMIGILEFANLVIKTKNILEMVESYAPVKFFFSIARTLLSAIGINLSTYSSLAFALTKFCSPSALIAALQVKTGISSEITMDDILCLFSSDFYSLIDEVISDHSVRDLVQSTCELVANWYLKPFKLNIEEYFSIGIAYVQNEYQMEALIRAKKKILHDNIIH